MTHPTAHPMTSTRSTTQHNALSWLDYLELAFWISVLALVALVVHIAQAMSRRPENKSYGRPQLASTT